MGERDCKSKDTNPLIPYHTTTTTTTKYQRSYWLYYAQAMPRIGKRVHNRIRKLEKIQYLQHSPSHQ